MSELDPRLAAYFAAQAPPERDLLFVNETLLALARPRRAWGAPLAWMGAGAACAAALAALGPLAGPAAALIAPLAAPAALIWSALIFAGRLGWARA